MHENIKKLLGVLVVTLIVLRLVLSHERGREMNPYKYLRTENTKEISPFGVICTHGAAGRLNNIIIHERSALYIAWMLNKTLVASPEITNYYDIDKMGIEMFPEVPFKMIVPYDQSLCDESIIWTIGDNIKRDETNQLQQLINIIQDKTKATVSGWDLFYKYPPPPGYFAESFMGHFHVRPDINQIVDEYIKEFFGNQPFVAVHLRDLEGGCKSDKCNPTYGRTRQIMAEHLPSQYHNLPIFVASDRQRPEIEATYHNRAMFFNKPCVATGCAVIDFEICSRSNMFIGTSESTSDTDIALWRKSRQVNGIKFQSLI